MLMNFSLGDSPLNTKAIYKGGRWKDRLIANKIAQSRRQKFSNGGAQLPTTPNVAGQAAKAQALEGDDDFLSERSQKRQKLSQNTSSTLQLAKAPKEVISSLFSSNPTSNAPEPKLPLGEELPAEPSNAPLIDGIDTFTSLGLRTNLAAHLLTKLHLKAPTAIQKATITQLIKEDSDAFIQAETGSGKTLAYLLPIVQRIMELSLQNKTQSVANSELVHRDSGLFAIILAPTRELCKQISVVLDSLLGCAHWIVAGTVVGGEKKKSEKARLRKGLNILVATPGRLADHLSNTKTLDVSNVRWLVLDEGDRLMELGFEEEIRGIVTKIEERSSTSGTRNLPGLPIRRTTVLCSATMKMDVQRLGEMSLKDAVHIKVEDASKSTGKDTADEKESAFFAPAQLKQSYILVPAKQRLVTLAALMKRTFARKGSVMKAIVFVSCADSVDFHFEALTRKKDSPEADPSESSSEQPSDPTLLTNPKPPPTIPTVSLAPLLTTAGNPSVTIHKLHGSLAQPLRTATLSSFSRSTNPCILLCTDVASRGLDLPNIDLVIEYDPPFAADDHIHRVGRTARAGRDGRAAIFLMPGPEEGYVDILKAGYRDGMGHGLIRTSATEILKRGFGGEGKASQHWEEAATEWQLDAERWVIENQRAAEMARKAYVSHVRAYATHVVAERGIFDVKGLHLGHLAKAFALRERPGSMGRGGAGLEKGKRGVVRKMAPRKEKGDGRTDGGEGEKAAVTDMQAAARKMRRTMNAQTAGAGEFNLG